MQRVWWIRAADKHTLSSNLISAHQSDLFETVAHSITQCAFVLITHQCSKLLLDRAHKTVCVWFWTAVKLFSANQDHREALFICFVFFPHFASKVHFEGQCNSVDLTASCRPVKSMFNLIQAVMRGFGKASVFERLLSEAAASSPSSVRLRVLNSQGEILPWLSVNWQSDESQVADNGKVYLGGSFWNLSWEKQRKAATYRSVYVAVFPLPAPRQNHTLASARAFPTQGHGLTFTQQD